MSPSVQKMVTLLMAADLVFGQPITSHDLSMDIRGQASLNHAQAFTTGFGSSPTTLRYIPEFRGDFQADPEHRWGMDIALDMYNHSLGDSLVKGAVDFYRLIVRYDSPRTQFRIGLQKINFGPARMLRVLQWFDQVDVRDPLALSPGVWAGLGRRYFENGGNLRLWIMADAPNPWRSSFSNSSQDWPWDMGGRLELPIPRGTVGMTIHQLDLTEVSGITESRAAADIRLDAVLGLWSEAMIARVQLPAAQRDMFTIMAGLDYTLGIGNGLYVALEALGSFGGSFDGSLPWEVRSVAMMSNYTLGLSDALVAYLYTIETPGITPKRVPMIGWNHTRGNWLFYLAVYDMPEIAQGSSLALPTGTGIQFNVAYSH